MNDTEIKRKITKQVHKMADEADWLHLNIPERQRHYEAWTADPQIGGQLSQVMPANRVRVYLKDTVLKQYSKTRRTPIIQLLNTMGTECQRVTHKFQKPEAILCDGSRLFTLAAAKDWRNALTSAFERAYELDSKQENVLILTDHTAGRFVDLSYRKVIEDAATRLEVSVIWLT